MGIWIRSRRRRGVYGCRRGRGYGWEELEGVYGQGERGGNQVYGCGEEGRACGGIWMESKGS